MRTSGVIIEFLLAEILCSITCLEMMLYRNGNKLLFFWQRNICLFDFKGKSMSLILRKRKGICISVFQIRNRESRLLSSKIFSMDN